MITAPYERILITVRYACGHYKGRWVFRTPETEQDPREQGDSGKCKACDREVYRDLPPQERVRYMVDGYPMVVFLDNGYWRGYRHEHRQKINKHFGKEDPRPLLEEVL